MPPKRGRKGSTAENKPNSSNVNTENSSNSEITDNNQNLCTVENNNQTKPSSSNEDNLTCEICKTDYHFSFFDISKDVYSAIVNSESFSSLILCCNQCRPKARKAFDLIENIDERLDQINTKIDKKVIEIDDKIKTRLDSFEKQVTEIKLKIAEKDSSLEDKIENINKTLEDTNTVKIGEKIERLELLENKIISQEEAQDRHRRRKNLIFYNLPESKSESLASQIKNDCEKLKSVFARKNFALSADFVINVIRLGKLDTTADKPRPLLLKLSTAEYKKEVLHNCRDLKYLENNLSTPIFYSLDLTQTQRDERRVLVQELKERKTNGEKNIGIRDGKVTTVKKTFPKGAQPSWADLFKSIF